MFQTLVRFCAINDETGVRLNPRNKRETPQLLSSHLSPQTNILDQGLWISYVRR